MEKFSKRIQKLPDGINVVRIFTDGSCYPNPGGPGGWSFIIQYQDGRPDFKSFGSTSATTNNRMELTAAIQALNLLKPGHIVELVTDSEYLGRGISQWMHSWCKTKWRVKNSDLWIELYRLNRLHDLYITCIRGHTGQPENEECDYMAEKARENHV